MDTMTSDTAQHNYKHTTTLTTVKV